MGWGDFAKKVAGVAAPSSIVGTIAGAGVSGALDFLGAKNLQNDAQSFSAGQAAASRAWQKTVMQNQVQWRYQDLEKAGINPIIASTMNGMSIPGNTAGSAGLAHASPGSSAVQAARTMAELNVMKAQANKLNAEALNTGQNIQIKEVAEKAAEILSGFIEEITDALGVDPDKPLTTAKPAAQRVMERLLPIPSRVRESVTNTAKEFTENRIIESKKRVDVLRDLYDSLRSKLEVFLNKY